jgi:histidinol-phosphatase (PHP family)
MMPYERVSIHGGHSGQFCNHAHDTLEAIIQAYIAKGFSWVGISEHMPPADDRFLYPEERAAGLNAASMADRFKQYILEGRELQKRYADRIEIFIGFETEVYTGAIPLALKLIETYQPDYVLGGVHHVDDIPFDYSVEEYNRAVDAAGDEESLYCRYFDQQLELIETVRPSVVAHFDLIRLFDPDYLQRWGCPSIAHRIQRNLESIQQRKMILDFNLSALYKKNSEPYLSKPLLDKAIKMNIPVVPGDDSHSVEMAGVFIDEGIGMLKAAGCNGRWRKPNRSAVF